MTTTIERRVRIVADSDEESPREWDCNFGTMACWHSDYNLGDVQPSESSTEWLRNLAAEQVDADDPDLIPDEHVERILEKYVAILPLYLYDHSGLTMNTGGFSCPWDSGQVGYTYCTLEKARENWLKPDATWDTIVGWPKKTSTMREAAERNLKIEVETYDQYLRGDVYGFIVEESRHCAECGHTEWKEVDSCWGFFGDDPETNGMADHLGDEMVKMAKDADIEYSR